MLTTEFFNQCISYNEQTGDCYWKKRPISHFKTEKAMNISNSISSGKLIDSIQENKNGKKYKILTMRIDGSKKQFLLHRVIWFLFYGYWPECIDHINGDGLDNRICNLRNVSITENNRNLKMMKTNKSGFTGVSLNKYGSYTSYIWECGSQVNIGTYDSFAEAVAARVGAERALGYRFNHGKK